MCFHKYKHVRACAYLYKNYTVTYNYVLRGIHKYNYYYTYTFIYPDIDECNEGTHVCTPHTCVNTIGSYTCGCNSGYLLDTDGFTCNGKHKRVYHYDY